MWEWGNMLKVIYRVWTFSIPPSSWSSRNYSRKYVDRVDHSTSIAHIIYFTLCAHSNCGQPLPNSVEAFGLEMLHFDLWNFFQNFLYQYEFINSKISTFKIFKLTFIKRPFFSTSFWDVWELLMRKTVGLHRQTLPHHFPPLGTLGKYKWFIFYT